MIRRILLPVGDPATSAAAVPHAEWLARTHDATVVLLGVVDVEGIERSSSGAGAGASYYAKALRERRLDDAATALTAHLEELARDLDSRGVAVRVERQAGPLAEVIDRHARLTDFVVVARDCNFRFETSDEPGDTLFKLLRTSSRLTMVIPPGPFRPVKRVLLAHDFTSDSSRVVYLMMHVRPFPDAEMLVVHADPDEAVSPESYVEYVEYVAAHGFPAELVVRHLKPSAAILAEAQAWGADCVVLGAYDSSKVREVVFGSTARRVLDGAGVPLVFGI